MRPGGDTLWVVPDTLPTGRAVVAGVDGPWAHPQWRAWRDTAPVDVLADSALAALEGPSHAWGAMHTWGFVLEALEARVAQGDTAALAAALRLASSPALTDSLAAALAERYSQIFENDPHLFAAGTARLALEARDTIVELLLDGWLHRAIRGVAPREPPSARLAAGPTSGATRRLQAKLAMREPEYLRALRDALEGRHEIVT